MIAVRRRGQFGKRARCVYDDTVPHIREGGEGKGGKRIAERYCIARQAHDMICSLTRKACWRGSRKMKL